MIKFIKNYFDKKLKLGSAGRGKKVTIYDGLVNKYGKEKALEMLKGANSVFEPKSK